jgi:hypothetical protein
LNVFEAPFRARFAVASALLLVVVMVSSIWRSRPRLNSEAWQLLHGVVPTQEVGAALVRMFLVGHYLDGLWKQVLWGSEDGRIHRSVGLDPRVAAALVSVARQPGGVSALTLELVAHGGFSFMPGQYGELATTPAAACAEGP